MGIEDLELGIESFRLETFGDENWKLRVAD